MIGIKILSEKLSQYLYSEYNLLSLADIRTQYLITLRMEATSLFLCLLLLLWYSRAEQLNERDFKQEILNDDDNTTMNGW